MIDTITQDNLHLSCRAKNKAEVLAMIGADFRSRGYVSEDCVAFLAERERQVSTFWVTALRCRICLNQPPASLSKRGGDLSVP